MRLEARGPGKGDVNVAGLLEMQVRGLKKLFESDGYTVVVTDEPRDVAEKEARKAAKGIPSSP